VDFTLSEDDLAIPMFSRLPLSWSRPCGLSGTNRAVTAEQLSDASDYALADIIQ
jgi:hypothetical protein